MTRERKYLNLTDTDIDTIIESFEYIITVADDPVFIKYIDKQYKNDLKEKGYNPKEIIIFCSQIYDFISKKRDKLRVKSDLKLNKDNLFELIFENMEFNLNNDIRFQLVILFEYSFSKHEIYDHLDNMEDNYKSMYDKYLSDYDNNNLDNTY